ncbi:hypothetical protein Bca4012_089824 [Brassica carinata]
MAVKTDMSKVYDRIEWKFIEQVLQRLGFHDKWTNWILQCVSTYSYSYLINETVLGSVKPHRGIRQGDTLSPYLFILCGQVLSGLCSKAERDGILQGIRVARGSPRVNHLLFADDTMFFCNASPESCSKLKSILLDYEKASGQKINSEKSSITFSSKTPEDKKTAAKTLLGIDKEGGTGLRDIQLFNQALLAKQAWRILTTPDCLLSRILLGKYCHKTSFLEAQTPAVCSHGWRSILHDIDLLKGNVGRVIGNGEDTKVWNDSWITLQENIKIYGPVPETGMDLRVSDLLTSEMKWNESRLKEFIPLVADRVKCIRPSETGATDTYIWQAAKSGIYSSKSGYFIASMGEANPGPADPNSFDWIKDIWRGGNFSPKMRMFLWLIVQNALPLGVNLQHRGINSEAVCKRCKDVETAMHTFFFCPFAQRVWELIPLHRRMSIATDRNFKDAIIKFRKAVCLPPSGVSGNIPPGFVGRCGLLATLIFEDQLSTPEETATRAIRSAQEWGLAQGLKDQIPKRAENQPNLNQHQPERNTIMVCKSDAAWDKGSNKAGLAWILTDASGICKHRGATTQDFVSRPLIAEALALRSGIISAAAMEISDLQMLYDNQRLLKPSTTTSRTQRSMVL